jgi:hypothetical protein
MDIKDYRQPMVTSIGVILGFLIGFLGQWVTEDSFALKNTADYVIFYGCFCGVILLFISLFRMLTPKVPKDGIEAYYYATFLVYMAGVIISFGSIFSSVIL